MFICTPNEASIAVFDENGLAVQAEADGTFLLVVGNYTYAAACDGYVTAESVEFSVLDSAKPIEIAVELEAEENIGSGTETSSQDAMDATTEDYRAWAQSDSRWGSLIMGTSTKTVADEGCLVTAATKLLIQSGLKDSSTFNVATFVNWANNNNGFTDGNAMYWSAPDRIGGFTNIGNIYEGTASASSKNSDIINWIKAGYHLAIQVKAEPKPHWVAVDEAKSLSTGTVYIMDSIGGYQNADITLASRYSTIYTVHAWTGGTTPSGGPAAPTMNNVKSNYPGTSTYITFTWDEVSGATQYKLRFAQLREQGWYEVNSSSYYTYTGLSSDALYFTEGWYNVTIYASNSGGETQGTSYYFSVGNDAPDYTQAIPVTSVEYNGHLYERYDYHMGWSEAKEYCEKLGGHLAVITSAGENSAVESLLTGLKNAVYYLGFSDTNQDGSWDSVTGETVSYTNWTSGEPSSDANKYYASMQARGYSESLSGGYWRALVNKNETNAWFYCYGNTGFICEYDTTTVTGKCGDNLTWELTPKGVLTISGTGAMYDYSTTYTPYGTDAPWYDYRNSIEYVVVESGVTYIGECAFARINQLLSVDIASSVIEIGRHAFYQCGGLKGVSLREGLQKIDVCVFTDDYLLESVTIPSSVSYIGDYAFVYAALREITFETANTGKLEIEEGAFYNEESTLSRFGANKNIIVRVSDKKNINAAIQGYDWLSSGRTATYINIGSEYGTCGDNLTWELDTDGVLTISGTGKMKDWSDVRGVSWVDKCKDVQSVAVLDGVTSIGDHAFQNFKNMTSITLSDTVTSIGYEAFDWCRSLTSITIPNSVTSIGSEAFIYCDKLTNITIPNSVTSIGSKAFQNCESLTSVIIPNSITVISDWLFYRCESLKSITIPSSVTTIESGAFHNCTSLKDVYYGGSASDWKNVTISSCNDYLTSATIHYTEEEVVLSTYTVSYDANGGSGAPSAQEKVQGSDLTLSTVKPTRQNYTFEGWATTAVATTAAYQPGGKYSADANVTLYAVWEENVVIDETAPIIRVASVKTRPGSEVDVQISLENNPGIIGMTLKFDYDSTAMTLTSITESGLTGTWQKSTGVAWTSDSNDNAYNGVFLTLKFIIAEDAAEGDYAVTVKYSEGDICNDNLDDVNFTVVPGTVTVSNRIPGDVNGDEKVNTKDFITLMKLLAGDDIYVVPGSTDINADGKVNTKDFITLMKYLAGDDIAIY